MWLITTDGFYSIVDKTGDGTLTVRARVAADLDRLRDRYLPGLGPTVTGAGTDYAHRATASRQEVADALAAIAADIDYANFKDAVAERQGYGRAAPLGEVWSVLYRLQRSGR